MATENFPFIDDFPEFPIKTSIQLGDLRFPGRLKDQNQGFT
jgi:hypothetical protein